eukprot:5207687-Pleurochrysis_carterae.AAC.1
MGVGRFGPAALWEFRRKCARRLLDTGSGHTEFAECVLRMAEALRTAEERSLHTSSGLFAPFAPAYLYPLSLPRSLIPSLACHSR